MSERLKHLGRQQELELERKSLDIQMKGLIANLRDALDPLAPIEDLPSDKIGEWSQCLATTRERYRQVVADLKLLKEILG